MKYSIRGDFYRIMCITGPTHNLLGLSFSQDATGVITLEKLTGSSDQTIDEGQMKQAVLSGVDEANATLGTNYHVSRIQYVPTDTPAPAIYAHLARRIVERLATGARYDGD